MAFTPLSRTGWVGSSDSNFDTPYTPAQTLDSDINTRWISGGGALPHWISMDMGSAQTFNTVTYVPQQNANQPATIELYVSSDGSTWGSPVATLSGLSGTGTVTLLCASQTCRYFKLNVTASNGPPYAGIAEVNAGTTPPGNVRLTQLAEEALLTGSPSVRLTKVATEAVIAASPLARLTKFALETVIPSAAPTARGNIDYDQVRVSVRQGSGGMFQMFGGGSVSTGHVAVFDANGNVIDGGGGTTILPIRSVSANTTMTLNDYTVIGTVPSITITLPTGAAVGQMFNVKNANVTTGQLVTVSAAVNIDQATSLNLGATASLTVQWDGTQWRIL